MKKFLKILFAFIFLMIPFAVKADWHPATIGGYSLQAAVGSDIYFYIRGTDNLDGSIKYNANELEFVDSYIFDPSFIEGGMNSLGTIKIVSKASGDITFKYSSEEFDSTEIKDLVFHFKVNAAPASGKLLITFEPKDTSIFSGEKSVIKEYEIIASGIVTDKNDEATTNTVDEIKDEANEIKEKANTIIDKAIEKTETANNIMTYVPWVLSGVLFVALIVVAVKKKEA